MPRCSKCGGKIVFRYIDGSPVPIHLSGGCSGSGSYSNGNNSTLSESARRRIIKSFTIPNATCPVCGDTVFYYQNEYGSKVFFDELGPPWTKHPCTDTQKGKWSPRFLKEMPKSLRSRSLWVKFYPQSHEPIVNGNRSHIIEWKGFYKNPDDGYSEVIRFVTRSKYPTEQLNLNTAYIANSDEGFLKICLITKGKSPHLTVLTSTEKVYIRTEGNRRTYYIMRKRGLPKNGSKKSIKSSTKNITDYVDIEPMDQLIHCPICSNSFSNERGLKTHLKQHWQSETLGIFEHLEFDEWVKVIFKLNNNVNE